MSQKKCKLVLKTNQDAQNFEIAKSVNTIEFGIPGNTLTEHEVQRLLKDQSTRIQRGLLTVEFV